ncbi:gamma-type small acid-soluble spore protein [Bacillus carboniphilus]|uniref:Small, acid-soluble spore protein gamma-type n=1 Tax=Bacillus carboniphilus TaxID=86663 RepID=A0ABY9JW26_9BACI|nr:gamma-type small acid-soluble spore protein [Bacillus carboniphilus]WLR42677.1 gamma-type small acid-soluble spore protein [Bacillus carboniphilus]
MAYKNQQNQKQQQPQYGKTNAQHVKQQNAAAAQGQYGTEYAAETDAAHVKQQNAKAEQNKQQNS